MRANISTQINILPSEANGIHSGASTHHQDQAITAVSLSTIKATASRGKNPIITYLVPFGLLLTPSAREAQD